MLFYKKKAIKICFLSILNVILRIKYYFNLKYRLFVFYEIIITKYFSY
jgi:hypothetical protein